MPELPLELCQAIVDEVGAYSDLLRLLLVSINFNSAVERRLYHTISFSGKSPPPDVIKRKWGVFERISTCPRVAAYVFHLTFDIQSWSLPPLTTTSDLAKVFLSVPNLKTLHVNSSYDLPRHFQTRVPFLLRTFSFTGHEFQDPSFRRTVEIFLEAQIELEELEFLADHDLRLPPSALPKLTTVSAGRKLLHTILPGRPVTRVAFQYGGRLVSLDAGPLSSLLLITNLNDGLHAYTTSFPTLEFLEYRAWNYEHAQSILHLECLLSLKKLKVVVSYRDKHEIARQELAFVGSTFAGCPSLCYIETCDLEAFIRTLDSTIWTRDSKTGIPCVWDSDEWKRW